MSSRSHPDCTFFCLCSFEYTKTASHRRTVQFRLKDLQIHDKHSITPHDAPDHIFLSTKAITLSLDTQKNSVRGESSSMATQFRPLHAGISTCGPIMLHQTLPSVPTILPYHRHHSPSSPARSLPSSVYTQLRLDSNAWDSTPMKLEPIH